MITLEVDYQLKEYLEILVDFVPIMVARKKGKPVLGKIVKAGIGTRLLIYSVGTVSFLFKKRKVGDCTFEFDKEGLSRASKLGKKHIRWNDVVAIHILNQAYLIDMKQGAMPLPFRCFDQAQMLNFEAMVPSKLIRYKC